MRILALWIGFFFLGFSSPSHAGPYELSFYQEVSYFAVATALHSIGDQNESQKKAHDLEDLDNLDEKDLSKTDRIYIENWSLEAHEQSDQVLEASHILPGIVILFNIRDFFELTVMYAEVRNLTKGGTSYVKGTNSKYRPYAYREIAPLKSRLHRNVKRSFLSGHAADITAHVTFATVLFSDYYPSSPYIPFLWGGASLVIAYGAYLRVAAGRHFPIDSFAGSMWGFLVGLLVPYTHRTSGGSSVAFRPYSEGEEKGFRLVARF